MQIPLDTITLLLADLGTQGSFATRFAIPPDDLRLQVEGVGEVGFPITPAMARKLCAVAQPARHGWKDQTRLDKRVRDTWEIPGERIAIDEARWRRTFTPAMERIRGELGLPQHCRLEAGLHNLLVYARSVLRAAPGLGEGRGHDRQPGDRAAVTLHWG